MLSRKKKSHQEDFIDNKRYFTFWERKKSGDVVTYKRLSDDEISIGTIKWFEIDKSQKIVMTLIDSFLQNFQAGFYDDIVNEPSKLTKKLEKKLRSIR